MVIKPKILFIFQKLLFSYQVSLISNQTFENIYTYIKSNLLNLEHTTYVT